MAAIGQGSNHRMSQEPGRTSNKDTHGSVSHDTTEVM